MLYFILAQYIAAFNKKQLFFHVVLNKSGVW